MRPGAPPPIKKPRTPERAAASTRHYESTNSSTLSRQDERLEFLIAAAARRMACASTSEARRLEFARLRRLVAARSPERVQAMEIERGLDEQRTARMAPENIERSR